MTPWRIVLLAAGVLAACLAALWLSVTVGVWLALHAATGAGATRLATGAALAVTLGILARGLVLLADDLRTPERRR